MSYSRLYSIKGGYIREYMGDFLLGVIIGDARS